MNQALREIILNHQEKMRVPQYRRDSELRAYPQKVSVCVGIRRCGKSTLMEQVMQDLLKRGVAPENICSINFADDRLWPSRATLLSDVDETYYGFYPEKRGREKVYFFLDEIQDIPHWELLVERLRREEECELYLTGSSAGLLSKEIATQLRGRTMTWELFPFSFREFLQVCDIDPAARETTRQRQLLQKAWERYETEGGFPEVFGMPERDRIRTHQGYYDAVLLRDVIERYRVSSPMALRYVATRLVNQISCLCSVNKLVNELKSMGEPVGREKVSQYIKWLEDAYFLYLVPCYSASASLREREARKIYAVDHSMAVSLGAGILRNRGQLLENAVFMALRRRSPNVYYYKTEKGYEVDFAVVPEGNGPLCLVQVCESLAEPKTRRRELRALEAAMQERGVSEAWLITREERAEVPCEGGTVHVRPAYSLMDNEMKL